MCFIFPSFGKGAVEVLAAKSGIRGASFCFRWLRGSERPLMSSNNPRVLLESRPPWKLLEEHLRPLVRRSHFGNKVELYQKPELDAVSCSREPIFYLNSAFRSSRNNHVFMFIKYMYVVLKYDPASPAKDLLVRGPLMICDGFPFLYDTFFQNYGVDAAFGCHGDNDEAFLFSRYGCAKIKYDPDTFLGDLIQGPMLTNEMFPFPSRIDFLGGLDAAFESTVPGEAYLFQGVNYALVNYTKRSQVSTGFIKDLFPCLQNTVFVRDIGAAFASHAPNQAYLFKDSSYVIIHYTPGKPDDSYIVAGPEEIVPANWPSLRGIVPHDIILHDVIEPITWTPIWDPKDHSWKVGPIDYWEKLDEEAGGVGALV